MHDFPDYWRFNLGIYVDMLIDWLKANYGAFFDVINNSILWFMVYSEKFLQWLPWWLVVAVVFVLGWRLKNLLSGLVFALLIFIVGTFGLWELMMSTLAIVLTSVVISLLIGIPIGILMTYSSHLDTAIKPILDGMQTMPSFVYLIPAVIFFDLGKVPAVFATTIYAVPPVIRLTNLGIRQVPKEMVEAAESFGSSRWQLLTKVQLPQALPTIMAGINQTTMMALAMVVIASMIGAKGLGMEVLIAINRLDIARGFESGLSIVFLAIIIDRISQGIANRFEIPE